MIEPQSFEECDIRALQSCASMVAIERFIKPRGPTVSCSSRGGERAWRYVRWNTASVTLVPISCPTTHIA